MSNAQPSAIDFNQIDATETNQPKEGLRHFTQAKSAYHSMGLKEQIDELAAQNTQRQARVKHIHQLLQAINKLSNEKGLDLSQLPEAQKNEVLVKLKVAKDLGIDIDETRLTYGVEDRNFLKESLQSAAEDFNNETREQVQRMQMLIQASQSLQMFATDVEKSLHHGNEAIEKHI